ncbi:MAG: DUF3021 domain-containing protein [Lachnospiraceae bacterium]|nr:DUF3021 domain-containing protein [Lachnospiraceae bacterium]MBO5144776.1 DUF3021 domain-containing protein [Lachnospiraceae bacterium]
MKNLLMLLFRGVTIALSLFAVFGMFFDIMNDGIYYFENFSYTKMVIGAIAVGIGFSIPALIYESKRIPYAVKVFIHMGTGCTILLITGFAVGWIPVGNGVFVCTAVVAVEFLAAFLIWAGFSLYYKKMAKRMNEQIKSLNH